MKIRLGLVSLLAFFCFAFGPHIQAQQLDTAQTVRSRAGGEMNSVAFDSLAVEHSSSQERIFVIARLGYGENNNALNRLRLQAARAYLIDTRGVNPANVLFAAGERVAGEGRVGFYLGSRLTLISLAERNPNVVLNCCGDTIPQLPRRGKRRAAGR